MGYIFSLTYRVEVYFSSPFFYMCKFYNDGIEDHFECCESLRYVGGISSTFGFGCIFFPCVEVESLFFPLFCLCEFSNNYIGYWVCCGFVDASWLLISTFVG